MAWDIFNFDKADTKSMVNAFNHIEQWCDFYEKSSGAMKSWVKADVLPSALTEKVKYANSAIKKAKSFQPYFTELRDLKAALDTCRKLQGNSDPYVAGTAYGQVLVCAAKILARAPSPANAYATPLEIIGGKLGTLADKIVYRGMEGEQRDFYKGMLQGTRNN